MALQVQSGLLASRAVGERNVVVGNIVEGVDWSITPSFVEESTIFVKGVKVVGVCL
jgi:hypothetical protein